MHKTRLFTPGPTPVLSQALKVMSEPILHHRSADFVAVLDEVRSGLKDLFGTSQEVLLFASSGTGAMEGTIVNLFSPRDQVIVIRAGKFGERWGDIASAYDLDVVTVDVPWGKAATVDKIQQLLLKYPNARAVLLQACETSTAVDFPIEDIAAFMRNQKPLFEIRSRQHQHPSHPF